MSTADELRAALAVAELEERLVAAKEDGSADLEQVKAELRYRRWVARGGPAEEQQRLADPQIGAHTNRAVADLYGRWLNENTGV